MTARLRDLAGRAPAEARLGLFTGVTGAQLTGLTEDGTGPALPLADGAAVTAIGPAGTVTLALGVPPGAAPDAAEVSPPEPAQPVFTRYWLHGKGPAPAGNLPVAVHLSPTRLAAPGVLRLTVAAGTAGASGAVELDVPDGLVAAPRPDGATALPGPEVALRYQLPPLGYAEWELTVRGVPGAAAGHYFLAARIPDQLGQRLEDVAAVRVGLPPLPSLSLPLDDLLPAVEADQRAVAAELEVTVLTPALRIAAGGRGELAVRLANRATSPIRGEAQLISPYGSWAAVHPWTRGFTVSPEQEITLRYHVRVPVTTRRGTQWWTMVKLMYFGRLHYTSAVPVDVRD